MREKEASYLVTTKQQAQPPKAKTKEEIENIMQWLGVLRRQASLLL